MKLTVFLSYAHKDWDVLTGSTAAFLSNLEHQLKATALTDARILRDEETLRQDHRFDDKLADRIDAANLMLVLFSPSWLQSEECWKEFEYALASKGVERICFLVFSPVASLPPGIAPARRAQVATLLDRVRIEHQADFQRNTSLVLRQGHVAGSGEKLLAAHAIGDELVERLYAMFVETGGAEGPGGVEATNLPAQELAQQRQAAAALWMDQERLFSSAKLRARAVEFAAVPADPDAGVMTPFAITRRALRPQEVMAPHAAREASVGDLIRPGREALLPKGFRLATEAEWRRAMQRVGQPWATPDGLRRSAGRFNERETWDLGAWGVHPPGADCPELTSTPFSGDDRDYGAQSRVALSLSRGGAPHRRSVALRSDLCDYALRLVWAP